ncbi:hypothetical protein EVAR_47508_1 [Eumeta japonica]|uniref:Uncharacterized protein n=1 Tax=Eumeta variegata TaxID=151549 RepID=A0A4C1XR69_EUMVA|nr:hypothetical protein EVAR_47508_1 [Eumeta japonica]
MQKGGVSRRDAKLNIQLVLSTIRSSPGRSEGLVVEPLPHLRLGVVQLILLALLTGYTTNGSSHDHYIPRPPQTPHYGMGSPKALGAQHVEVRQADLGRDQGASAAETIPEPGVAAAMGPRIGGLRLKGFLLEPKAQTPHRPNALGNFTFCKRTGESSSVYGFRHSTFPYGKAMVGQWSKASEPEDAGFNPNHQRIGR